MDLWLEMLEWAISTDSFIFLTNRHTERQTHAYGDSSIHPLPPTLSLGVAVVVEVSGLGVKLSCYLLGGYICSQAQNI